MLSDSVRLRKLVAGISLIGFPLAGVISSVFDANEGTGMTGKDLYAIAVAHHGSIMLAAVIFIVSSILTVPAVGGILHLVKGRGAGLVHVGAGFALIGAFGHMGYAVWQMMLAPAGTPKPIITALDTALQEALADPEILKVWAASGMSPYPKAQRTPEGAAAYLKSEIKRWGDVIRDNHIEASTQ